jgi:ABC-2 type transport system permease protein
MTTPARGREAMPAREPAPGREHPAVPGARDGSSSAAVHGWRPLVFLKALSDQRRGFIGWSLAAAAYVAFLMPFYSTIKSAATDISGYLENLPGVLKNAFLGSAADFTSPAGFLDTELFSWLVPLLFIAFAIGASARALAGEEEAGTLSLLLSYPVSRTILVLEKFAAVVAGVALLAVAMFLTLVIVAAIAGIAIGAGALAQGVLLGALLGLATGSIAFAVATATGRRTAGIVAGTVVAALTYLLNLVAGIGDSVHWLRLLSYFHYYGTPTPLTTGVTAAALAVFLVTIVLMVTIAVAAFRRHDVRV